MTRRTSTFLAATVLVASVAATFVPAAASAIGPVATPPAGSTLVVLGDSLTWGANHFGQARARLAETGEFESVVYDGWWSRRIGGITSTTYSGANTYKKLVADGVRPSAVLVALGTNDVLFSGRRRDYARLIRELMDTIGPLPVVWVNVHRVDSSSTARRSRVFNSTLAEVLSGYPLASVFDWAELATSEPRVMAADRIHNTPSGYRLRTMAYLEISGILALRVAEVSTEPAATTTTTVS